MAIDWWGLAMGEPQAPRSLPGPANLEDWDEDKTKFNRRLFLRASTWKPYTVFPDAPRVASIKEAQKKRNWVVSPDEKMAYVHLVLKKGEALQLAQAEKRGWVQFDDDVEIPSLWKIEDGCFEHVWMGYSPMEILSQRQGVRLATGTVVVGGLGMGWLLHKVHAKPSVRKIIVVEQSKALLDWFGYAMCSKLPKVEEVVCGDVRDHYVHRYGTNTRFLIDIYEEYGSAPGQQETEARKRGLKLWCWGEYADRMQTIRW